MNWVKIEELKGKTLKEIIGDVNSSELIFVTTEGDRYKMYHEQDCCESVRIEDINGDLQDLIGSPLLVAEEVSDEDTPPASGSDDSFTWTFYNLATVKANVQIRWFGTSNGYYSESVDIIKMEE